MLEKAQAAAADRYRSKRSLYHYSRCKVSWDPAYVSIRDSILSAPPLPVLDVGCGIGLFAAYLRESGVSVPITGVDPDAEKIRIATSAVSDGTFLAGGIDLVPTFRGHVVVLDVLHYFNPEERENFLISVIENTASGGSVWLRTTLRDGSWRYWVTQMEEVVVRSTRWIVGGRWNFPSRREIVAPFAKAGFSVKSGPMWGRTPFNSYLFEMTRPS